MNSCWSYNYNGTFQKYNLFFPLKTNCDNTLITHIYYCIWFQLFILLLVFYKPLNQQAKSVMPLSDRTMTKICIVDKL